MSHVCEVMAVVCVFSVSQHVVGGNGPVVVARPVLGAQTSHRPELLPQRVPGPASRAGATGGSKHLSQKGKRSRSSQLRRRIKPSGCFQWRKLEIENHRCRISFMLRTTVMHLFTVVTKDGKASCWILTGAPFSISPLQD